jgi:DNA gyrase subunit A
MICVDDVYSTVMVVSEKGYGKRTYLNDPEDKEPIYRITNRGGKGVKTLNVSEKTGPILAIKNVTDEDDLMIITKSGITIRMHIDSIRTLGRAAQGVRLINLKGNSAIAAIARVPKSDDEEDEMEEGSIEGSIEGENGTEGGAENEESGTDIENEGSIE